MKPHQYFFFAMLLLGVAGCSKDESVLDPVPRDSYPLFQHIAISTTGFDTDTMGVKSNRTPDDPIDLSFSVASDFSAIAGSSIPSATVTVRREGSSSTIASMPMTSASGIANRFLASMRFIIKRGDVGDYRVEVRGVDSRGVGTNSVFTKFRVINGSNPPVLCGITAPDTLTVPPTGSLVFALKACVSDPSGRQDIKRVWFNSFDPTGKQTSGGPFVMYDDGSHGDDTANDGTYALTVQLPSTTTRGKYRFEFQAFDYGNLGSNVLTHFIMVL